MNINSNHRVLLLDGDTLSALSILRSLGKKGISVDVAAHTSNSISACSKYAKDTYCYPHPLNDTKAFIDWTAAQLQSSTPTLIIPATERTLVPISRSFGNTPAAAQICMAGPDALETVLDKFKTTKMALSLAIPQARSWQIRSLEELAEQQEAFTFPMVIKPGRSIADSAQRLPLTVKYAHSAEELRNICEEMLGHVHLVLQTYFRGVGMGIELIADQGEILYAFQHQRLHEMPLSGGGSSYRMSVEIDPELLDASRKIVKHLSWNGVAMVEFKKNLETGDFVLIEINGRFWGSLPLAVAAGADFPYMLYQLYNSGKVASCPPYKRNIKCRKLSSDIAWLEAVVRKDADQRLVHIPSISSALKDALDIFSPRHHFDAQHISDMKPGLIDFKAILSSYVSRLQGIFTERKQQRKLLKSSHYDKIEKNMEGVRNVLFICYGNINRSAVAHALANKLVDESMGYTFRSAGFHPVGDRPVDHRMVAIAEENAVPMQGFTSTIFTADLAEWADIIFVMETGQIEQSEQLSKSATGKTFLLGGLSTKNNAIEIADPYGKSPTQYLEAFTQVRGAVLNLRGLAAISTVQE